MNRVWQKGSWWLLRLGHNRCSHFLFALSYHLLWGQPATILSGHLNPWRGLRDEEPKPPSRSHMSEFESNPSVSVSSSDSCSSGQHPDCSLMTGSEPESLCQAPLNSWPPRNHEMIKIYCPKSLYFELICIETVDNCKVSETELLVSTSHTCLSWFFLHPKSRNIHFLTFHGQPVHLAI